MKGYRFVTPIMCISCYFVCDLSYFHVVLCPSSCQILVTPLIHAVGGVSAARRSASDVSRVSISFPTPLRVEG